VGEDRLFDFVAGPDTADSAVDGEDFVFDYPGLYAN
jgi:hypothetical protein